MVFSISGLEEVFSLCESLWTTLSLSLSHSPWSRLIPFCRTSKLSPPNHVSETPTFHKLASSVPLVVQFVCRSLDQILGYSELSDTYLGVLEGWGKLSVFLPLCHLKYSPIFVIIFMSHWNMSSGRILLAFIQHKTKVKICIENY